MKTFALVAVLLLVSSFAFAQANVATQTFQLGVNDISVLAVSGDPGDLEIVAPAAGGDAPDPVSTGAVTNLDYTTVIDDGEAKSITAELSVAVPAGTTLDLAVGTPGGGEGTPGDEADASWTGLDISAQTIVDNIGSCYTDGAGPTLDYTLSITDWAAVVSADMADETVTFTLTAVD